MSGNGGIQTLLLLRQPLHRQIQLLHRQRRPSFHQNQTSWLSACIFHCSYSTYNSNIVHKGDSIQNVRAEGVYKKCPILWTNSTDRLREMRTRRSRREGVKNPEHFAYVLNTTCIYLSILHMPWTWIYPRFILTLELESPRSIFRIWVWHIVCRRSCSPLWRLFLCLLSCPEKSHLCLCNRPH